MNFKNSVETKQKVPDFTFYKHFFRIDSIKDLRFVRAILNPLQYLRQFLAANVEKMLLFCQSTQLDFVLYISEKPYLTEKGKLVYLYSFKNFVKNVFIQEDSSLFGSKIIAILKSIYNTVYSQQQNPPDDFKQMANYIIDHEDEISQNLITKNKLKQMLIQFDFILKNSLQMRINRSLLLEHLNLIYQDKHDYFQIAYEVFKSSRMLNQTIKKVRSRMLESLQSFLALCTKDGIFVFPAKKTLDSKSKNQVTQIQDHLIISIITKESRDLIFKQKLIASNFFHKKMPFQFTQIIFSLTRKNQNDQQCILIKLQTEYFISGTTFLFFDQFFHQILEKYTDLYLQKPFQSSFEESLNKTYPAFRQKQLKLDFVHKVFLSSRQNIIANFIKNIDLMIIIYLVFQEFLSRLKEQNYLEKIMDSSYTQKKDIIERELANDLYNSIKYYLEKFTVFKRKYFSFTERY